MNKENLKRRLLELQKASLASLEEKINTTHSMVDVDETDTIDPEDLSHQFESTESEYLFKQQLIKARLDLDLIEHTDFGPKDFVEAGAYVKTDQFNFVIVCATTPFDWNGEHIVGISTDSPMFKEMKDLKVGSTFSVLGKEYSIKEIH